MRRAVEQVARLDAVRRSTPLPALRRFALSDAGNAEYFAALYGRDSRFDHKRQQWLFWRGGQWQLDRDGERYRLAKQAMRARLKDAANQEDENRRRAEVAHSLASESRGRLEALLALARSERPIADAGDGWDSDPWLLGVQNGIVDLRTGELRAATRDDRISLRASVSYQPDAKSDLWDGALRAILPDDQVRAFVQKAIGYSASGDTRCDVWFLLEGSGRNGKGILIQPIRRALGDYALELPASVLDTRVDRAYELAKLPGLRFVTSSEVGDTIRLNHDRLKQLTGGDAMSASGKYQHAIEFVPVGKLWLSCNRLPTATDDSPAFWARVRRIPFQVSFAGREDQTLRPRLTHEPRTRRPSSRGLFMGLCATSRKDSATRLQPCGRHGGVSRRLRCTQRVPVGGVRACARLGGWT